jgi:hypothetical protein
MAVIVTDEKTSINKYLLFKIVVSILKAVLNRPFNFEGEASYEYIIKKHANSCKRIFGSNFPIFSKIEAR